MTFASVSVTIYDKEFSSCHISELDGAGNDFEAGDTNVFEGSELDECERYYVADNVVSMLRLQHSGLDGWKPEYVRVRFDDGGSVTCPDGEFIDGDEIHDLSCASDGRSAS